MTPPPPTPLSRWSHLRLWAAQHAAAALERARNGEYVFLLSLAAFVGLLGGLAAIAFDLAIRAVQTGCWGRLDLSLDFLRSLPPWRILLAPALGGLAVGVVTTFFAPEAKGHGVPEVIKAVAAGGGRIRGRVAFAKTVASAFTIGSGGSAGREGPIIQIGAAVGSRIGQAIGMSRRCLRTLVGCGAAAGIAATFNAPVAGALFAGEVILGEFALARFSPIVISSVVATVVMRLWRGDTPVFSPPPCRFASPWELFAYVLLGLLCGFISLLYIHLNDRVGALFSRLRRLPPVLLPALGGLAVGALALLLPQIMGDGHRLANLAFNWDSRGWPALLLLAFLFAKMLATTVTLGSGGSGGVFSPALTIGALLGALFALGIEPLLGPRFGGVAAYALAGMGGLLAGSMLAPITAILMIFEISSNYAIILPVMLTVIVSTAFVMKNNSSLSIYTMKLVRDGVPLFRGASPSLLANRKVRDLLQLSIATVPPSAPASLLLDRMRSSALVQFHVVDASGRLLGVIAPADARRILFASRDMLGVLMAEDLMQRSFPLLTPDDPLSAALPLFESTKLSFIPVVLSPDDPRPVGLLSYSDLMRAFHHAVLSAESAAS